MHLRVGRTPVVKIKKMLPRIMKAADNFMAEEWLVVVEKARQAVLE